ncbi:MAG: Glycerophosphoryl diester phosphodiesterase [Candidatus Ozemobacter sibiricus]|uniref:Glycerophosphoryl diester phosphodiesterase n=1 Tax=Candidatus Ozemobacter sibiricus TaxID=2268124 RepID=A0A367ZK01_9BACT|nr:MAG: Glycerophosphoryl diester phosphodiesterase [Candidatus Ozemobacter sibiricus]
MMAHRGDRSRYPENSLLSFQMAWEAGADLVETDLRLTRDGVPVCLHDSTVDRTTDGLGPIDRLTLAEARRLRLRWPLAAERGRPASQRASEPFITIPTLEEVAAAVPPDRGLALELKGPAFLQTEAARRVVAIVTRAGLRDRTIILSFARASLATFRAAAPDLPIGLITMRGLSPPTGFDVLGPVWPILFLNPWYVAQAHRQGQLVCPLDPTPEPRLAWYRWLDVDAILTDDPVATVDRWRGFG